MNCNLDGCSTQYKCELLKNTVDAYAYCKVLEVENSFIRKWTIIEADEAFERLSGVKVDCLTDERGHAFSDQGTIFRSWIPMCSKAVNEKEEVRFEEYLKQSDKWYTVRVYSKNPEFFLVIYSDITELKRGFEELSYLNFHDKLTGLYNRAFFEEELCRLNTGRQLPLSIILGSVNGLKLINRAFGRAEGNEILKEAADIIKTSCWKEDIISRVAGNEFAIILPNTSKKDAENICERIRKKFSETGHGAMQISFALGCATKQEVLQKIEAVYNEAEVKMQNNKLNEWKSIRSSIIKFLIKLLDERTHETEEHALRIKQLALNLGKRLGVSNDCLDEIALLAILHDIGKIAISDTILCKPDKLTDEEWVLMKEHCEIGYQIAISSYELSPLAEYILYHHENWDGSGYPTGKKSKEIPLVSRIIRVVDAYDAMTNDRPYHKAISKEQALVELRKCSGKQFDPEIVGTFIEMLNQ